MAKQDFKKIDCAGERHEIAQDIISVRRLKSFSQEKKNLQGEISWVINWVNYGVTPLVTNSYFGVTPWVTLWVTNSYSWSY